MANIWPWRACSFATGSAIVAAQPKQGPSRGTRLVGNTTRATEQIDRMRTTLATGSVQDFIGIPTVAIEADYSKFDSAIDIVRDAAKWGLLEELRELLCGQGQTEEGGNMRIARDIAYEFAGAKDRDFSVDVFIHVTGIAEFGASSLRDYASKHGCCHEWFRQEVDAMRKRLNLPPLPSSAWKIVA